MLLNEKMLASSFNRVNPWHESKQSLMMSGKICAASTGK